MSGRNLLALAVIMGIAVTLSMSRSVSASEATEESSGGDSTSVGKATSTNQVNSDVGNDVSNDVGNGDPSNQKISDQTAAGETDEDQVAVRDLFQAIEAGDVQVQFIAKNAAEATVLVKNDKKTPVALKMPEAFAAVPVLAQIGGGVGGVGDGGGGAGYGGSNGSSASQGLGGGFGGIGGMGGMGMGGMGMGGGVFNVAPKATSKLKVATVCLEHGKPDPNPRIKYELKPIRSFTTNQQVIEVCRMLGRREIDQVSAQATAWHLANGLSWRQLARKVKTRYRTGAVEMYFSPVHLRRAYTVVRTAAVRAKQYEQSQDIPSPGEKDLTANAH